MSQGPVVIFDKSTLEGFSVDESVLLDHFYRANIPPIFFVECLADLEFEFKRRKRMSGTPEQLVASLAERTPDSQSSVNMYHLRVLEEELAGRFYLSSALARPLIAQGELVQLGDSKGMIVRQSEEEQAFQRWSRHEFFELERQIARGWRQMLARIDLDTMSAQVLRALGPWRKPVSLSDARALTDTIVDNLDAEWLLRFGLNLLGVAGDADFAVRSWIAGGQKPLRQARPYFHHMLSIHIFFSLVLPAQLLKRVKPSHQVDLAYLYYLPFCSVFSSRDNFHVEVAPLFLRPDQRFVHGDALKADLKQLNEQYLGLPKEERETGLCGFAACPPDDAACLTTQLWDAYLPAWRAHSKPVDVPPEIQKALKELVDKFTTQSTPLAEGGIRDLSELGFFQIAKKIKPAKGSYLRFAKDIILKNYEDELRKRFFPPENLFAKLLESLREVFAKPDVEHVEVDFVHYKVDAKGEKVVKDDHHVAEIRPVGISGLDEEVEKVLREQFDRGPNLSLLVLWSRPRVEKLGILKFCRANPEHPIPEQDYEAWDQLAIRAYTDRHHIVEEP
jgi:hypothetical protein